MTKRIVIFASANINIEPSYIRGIKKIISRLIEIDYQIIFGGSNEGLMRIIGDTIRDNNGYSIGILPKSIAQYAHSELNSTYIVSTLEKRHQLFLTLGDMFLIFPGGMGTLSEFLFVLEAKKLELHNKPIILFNFKNYFNSFLKSLNGMTKSGFIYERELSLFTIINNINELEKVL